MNNNALEKMVEQGLIDADFLALPVAPVRIGVVDGEGSSNTPEGSRQTEPEVIWHTTPQAQAQAQAPNRTVPDNVIDIDTEVDPAEIEYYKKCPYHWLYSGHSNGWYHYARDDNEALEAMYSSSNNGTLTIHGRSYTFNFQNMTQSNGDSVRNILRVNELKHIALRGVAGLKLDKNTIRKYMV